MSNCGNGDQAQLPLPCPSPDKPNHMTPLTVSHRKGVTRGMSRGGVNSRDDCFRTKLLFCSDDSGFSLVFAFGFFIFPLDFPLPSMPKAMMMTERAAR